MSGRVFRLFKVMSFASTARISPDRELLIFSINQEARYDPDAFAMTERSAQSGSERGGVLDLNLGFQKHLEDDRPDHDALSQKLTVRTMPSTRSGIAYVQIRLKWHCPNK